MPLPPPADPELLPVPLMFAPIPFVVGTGDGVLMPRLNVGPFAEPEDPDPK